MKTIAKEKINICEAVVFDDDGVRRLDISADGFKVFSISARAIEKGEEVEFNMCESTKDFLVPMFTRKPIIITNGT